MDVIIALILREIHTLYGDKKIGYLWAIIQAGFQLLIYWGIRTFLHFRSPHGMTTLSYLACGIFIWYTFQKILTASMNAISANTNLLVYPHVYQLDIIIARTIVILSTQLLATSIIVIVGIFIGFDIYVSDLFLFFSSILICMIFSVGCGSILSALNFYIPVFKNIIQYILRFMFFVSGVFIPINIFSHKIGTWLYYNPILQIIEMLRVSMARGYHSQYYDISYLFMVSLSVLTIGLLLERFTRRRLQA